MLTPNRTTSPENAITRNAEASTDFVQKLTRTRELLTQAATEFSPATQASSLGAEDVVISHLINALQLDVSIFVLETGALHSETLALLERTQAHSRAPVRVFRPDHAAVITFVRNEGQDAIFKSLAQRKACCDIRKMEPLSRALHGQRAWITGLRREQSNARAEVPVLDSSNPTLAKFNPLADWTWGDVWHYIAEHKVDYNPLHDQFFPSVGCAPCTRAVSMGEDFRAGRWWWEQEAAKECGLHVTA
jgi:phosphoadenosine phosphosulfate reductase